MGRPRRILALVATVPLAALPVLGLTGCTQPIALGLPTASASVAATASPTPTSAAIPVPDVAALAERAVGSGTATSVEQEADATSWQVEVVQDDGGVDEVHLSSGGDLRAGPTTVETDADEASRNRAAVAAASVGLAGAARRMVAAVPGGVVTAIDLGRAGDRVAWIGDVVLDGIRHDVRIDAVNGSVLQDRADAEASSGGS